MTNGKIELNDASILKEIYKKIDSTGFLKNPLSIEEQVLICSLSKWIEDNYSRLQNKWIPCNIRVPEEKTNPITQDWYMYPVTIQVGNKRDIRYYKFGRGHWWHGPECMDKYVIAWKDITEPYNLEKVEGNILYKLTYGNRYITNVEEYGIYQSSEDLKSAALNFLESLPEYQTDSFRVNEKLPEDWYGSVFGMCTEISKHLEDYELGVHANYDII